MIKKLSIIISMNKNNSNILKILNIKLLIVSFSPFSFFLLNDLEKIKLFLFI